MSLLTGKQINVLAIGGSAGSIPVLISLLKSISKPVPYTVIIVIHRLKNVHSELSLLLSGGLGYLQVIEPDDKMPVEPDRLYLAPQNYHLLIEADLTFSLDYSEPVLFSRPSIDVTFESVAQVFGQGAVAILLSGANEDGARGIRSIIEEGGTAIIQAPHTAAYQSMPLAAIRLNQEANVLQPEEMIEQLRRSTG
ncbi:chemotaxis protein CheB [Arsenicibacter rosenii]|uniref:protein-glutamate methylesterase n=1 Tax=Arsenicibacter rosenii TaxID=1750698 RepID=A0A1S2VQ32_9BACT|nr:chemotaxis protein CheB [Arsenicibacter rosenii]OIN60872.1 chemotaxis protein CheB [Arsenicibacter rosenii]